MRKLSFSTTLNRTILQSMCFIFISSTTHRQVEMHTLVEGKGGERKGLTVESYIYAHWAQISFRFQHSFSSNTDRDIYSGESCYSSKTAPFPWGPVGWWKEEEFLSSDVWGGEERRRKHHKTYKPNTYIQKGELSSSSREQGQHPGRWQEVAQEGPSNVSLTTVSAVSWTIS